MQFFTFFFQIFHLRDIRWERSQFLSKSFLGFLAFNLLPYSLFGAEVSFCRNRSGNCSDKRWVFFSFLLQILLSLFSEDRKPYTSFFNGCYAALLLVVVVFFLIYGVEVFFKVSNSFSANWKFTLLVTRELDSRKFHALKTGSNWAQNVNCANNDIDTNHNFPSSHSHHRKL